MYQKDLLNPPFLEHIYEFQQEEMTNCRKVELLELLEEYGARRELSKITQLNMKSNLVDFFDRFLLNHMQEVCRKVTKQRKSTEHNKSMFIQKRIFNKEDAVFKNRSISIPPVQRILISEKKIIELLKSKTNDATTQLMIEISIFTAKRERQ